MSYPLFIARRYLMAQRKQAIIYVISLISVLGVIVGVAALVVVLALMTGFQDQIQAKIFGANAHLTVFSGMNGRPLDVPATLSRLTKCEPILAAAPVIYEKGMALSELNASGAAVLIKGVEPAVERSITDLGAQVRGDLGILSLPGREGRDRAILGKDLALNLGVGPGDVVRVIIAQASVSPFLTVPRSREFEVAGVADAGFYDYDSSRVYIALDAARRFMGLSPLQATAIEARVRDPRRVQEASRAVQAKLGSAYYVNDLIRMNRTFFSALRLEKLGMSIAIGLIVLVAALNIISILVLMVMEKVRDIGVLVAMGAAPGGIRRIFLFQGLIIAMVGTAAGIVLGVALAWLLDRYRLVSLPVDVYFIPYVPFHIRPLDVAMVAVLTVGVSFLATLYPSWRAARLDPSEALRYE
ncbi:MAG TPA: FtsX-like permease family protein [Candidatus Polarisedimenticolia bacterium]|jgi:lipoprotein-releasing system permease protein|nr:FtsX-like permease family protein [Candidatus Polarisedimenticolia bacterium]